MLRNASLLGLASLLLVAGCAAETDETSAEGSEEAITSASQDKVLDVPFYFSVPKSAITTPLNRSAYPYPTVWNPSTEVEEAGLRVIAVNQNGTSVANRRAARIDMAKKLGKAGVLQDGDITLSLRPNLAGTMPYPHIQMGVTHASLVYTQNGEAFNIDSPLDSDHVGQFSAPFFVGGPASNGVNEPGVDAIQIIRPRNMTDARRAQLRTWVGALKAGINRINGQRAQVKFQKDYMAPRFAATGMTPKQTVTKLGQIILEQDKTTKLPMYCSEFAWHMNALSACSAEEIENAGPEGADCVDPVFDPMPLVTTEEGQIGLAEGPLSNVLVAPAADRAKLIGQIFAPGDPGALSSGHRAVAEQVAPLMNGLSQFYMGKASGAPADLLAAGGAQLNAGVGNVGNYSPTAFIANATLPAGVRQLDYVATVVFVDGAADYAKAQRLAQNPVP
ncbi:MAG: hypothetical protein KIT84_41530 [Labilithrix sp.]|nr:hypothetical protein [Labilithrix sp.]MCW5817554.1 hypothetical protein [Labilithrix sp.]